MGAGLGPPPVPLVLERELVAVGRGSWSSGDIDEMTMVAGMAPVAELTRWPVNAVAVAFGGHGLQSGYLTYHLNYGRLSIHISSPWGGAYSDDGAALTAARDRMARAATLIATYEGHAAAGTLPAGEERLVVVEHENASVNACGWLAEPPLTPDDAMAWLAQHAVSDPAALHATVLLDELAAERVPDVSLFHPELRSLVQKTLREHPTLPYPRAGGGASDYEPWITASLGDLTSDVWFVAENPSAGAAKRGRRELGVEAQWNITPGDHRLRTALALHGFKDTAAEEPGGWRCYITDVIKSPFDVGLWNNASNNKRGQVAVWWAPVLAAELEIGRPKLIVTVGDRAARFLDRLTVHPRTRDMFTDLPPRESIEHYVSVASRPQKGLPGGHDSRIAAWHARFHAIQHHPARAEFTSG